jgi:hypothetical protein
MPICSLAAAAWRSASAISGRRSSSVDGRPTGMTGGSPLNPVTREFQFPRRLADQYRDGVLGLRALDAEVDQLRLRGVELGFGFRYVGVGCHSAGEAGFRESQILLVGLDGLLQQIEIAIEAMQREIIAGEFGLVQQADIFEGRVERLGGVGAGGHRAMDGAPHVGGVGRAHRKIVNAGVMARPPLVESRDEVCSPVTEGVAVTVGIRRSARSSPRPRLRGTGLRPGARSGWKC